MQQVLVQTLLGDLPITVGHGAGAELEVTVMVRRQFHADRYNRSGPVTPNDHTVPILATCFVNTWLKKKEQRIFIARSFFVLYLIHYISPIY